MTDERHEFQVVRSAADIPHFASEEEERQFWQTHEMGEEMFRNPELPSDLPLPARRGAGKTIASTGTERTV